MSKDVTGVRVVNDDGAQIVRARDIAIVGLDHDGSIRQAAVPRPGTPAEPGPTKRSPFLSVTALTGYAITDEADCAREHIAGDPVN